MKGICIKKKDRDEIHFFRNSFKTAVYSNIESKVKTVFIKSYKR